MARYFFDVKNGHRLVDSCGVECANDEVAKQHGRLIAEQIAKDAPKSAARRIAVINDEGREIATVAVEIALRRAPAGGL